MMTDNWSLLQLAYRATTRLKKSFKVWSCLETVSPFCSL